MKPWTFSRRRQPPRSDILPERRYALTLVAAFVLFCAQVLLLVMLIMAAYRRVLDLGNYGSPLMAGVLLSAMALLMLALAGLLLNAAFLSVSALRIGQHSRSQEVFNAWSERWVAVLLDNDALPPRPLPLEGLEALLELKDSLTGEMHEACNALIEHYGVEASLHQQLHAPFVNTKLQALESLAKLRSARAISHLLPLMNDPHPALRLMSARAVARSLAALPTAEEQRSGVTLFTEAVREARLPPGALKETLLLLEGRLEDVLALLLQHEHSASLTRAALECAGLLRLEAFKPVIARFLTHPDPEVRASALRTLASFRSLPPGAARLVREACQDPREFVRVQATRAAARLPVGVALGVLPLRLMDVSWWVRLAAAESLAGHGESGRELLRVAARSHPDPYARDMARQVLRTSSGTHSLGRGL
jgi:hypothetical protein